MASKTNCTRNGKQYYSLYKVVGHKLNSNGIEVPVRKAFYGKSKKEAEEKYNEYLNKKAMNQDSSKQYFGVMADRWIDTFLKNGSELANGTISLYVSAWNNYMKPSEIYHLPLEEVSVGMIQKHLNTLAKNGVSINSIKAVKKTLSLFYKHLVNNGYAPYNFTNSLTIPKQKHECKKEIVTWTDEELSCILNGFEKAQEGFRLRFFIVLASFTGLRFSELRGVKYEDIEKTPNGYVLNVRQQVKEHDNFISEDDKPRYTLETSSLKSTNSYRTIPLNKKVIDELKIHKHWHRLDYMKHGYRTDYIFTTSTGAFYEKANVNRALERYYKIIGVPNKGMHTYRHTFGTNLYKKGVPLKTASELLGHSDISITAKYYIGTGEEEKRKAVELLEDIV